MVTTARKTAASPSKTVKAPAATQAAAAPSTTETKVKKAKLVRDSFTIPKNEYLHIDSLKQRTALLGSPAKKSELLRAGIQLLSTLTDTQLRKALSQIPTVKTGRPGKQK